MVDGRMAVVSIPTMRPERRETMRNERVRCTTVPRAMGSWMLRGWWVLLACVGCAPQPLVTLDASDEASVRSDGATRVDANGDSGGDPCVIAAATGGDIATDIAAFDAIVQCASDASRTSAEVARVIEGFVRAVESRGGFPIVGAGATRFVYVRDARWDAEDDARSTSEDFSFARRAEPITVVGDFNDWNDGALTLRSVGHNLFVATLAMTPGSERWGYKFVARDSAGAPVLFSDPLSRRFQYDAHGRISFVRGGMSAGHLEWIRSVHATRLNNDRPVYLYLPPGYDQRTNERFPVLYMHDGNNLFDTAQVRSAPSSWDVDATSDEEILQGRARPFVIVAIPNNDARIDEYTHTRDTIDGRVMGGRGDDYVDFVSSELKPLIDRRYRTLTDQRNTGILGSSLGGLISFHAGLRAPTVFGLIGGMSSTFEWGGFAGGSDTMLTRYAMMAASVRAHGQRFYLDSGGGPAADGTCTFDGVDDPRDNFCETIAMRDTLVRAGIDTFPIDPNAPRIEPANANIYHWYERDALHNEAAWRARFHRVIRFFFRPH